MVSHDDASQAGKDSCEACFWEPKLSMTYLPCSANSVEKLMKDTVSCQPSKTASRRSSCIFARTSR